MVMLRSAKRRFRSVLPMVMPSASETRRGARRPGCVGPSVVKTFQARETYSDPGHRVTAGRLRAVLAAVRSLRSWFVYEVGSGSRARGGDTSSGGTDDWCWSSGSRRVNTRTGEAGQGPLRSAESPRSFGKLRSDPSPRRD
jgi:hypothetical protein